MRFFLVWSDNIASIEKYYHRLLFKNSLCNLARLSFIAIKKEEDDWWKMLKEEMKGK